MHLKRQKSFNSNYRENLGILDILHGKPQRFVTDFLKISMKMSLKELFVMIFYILRLVYTLFNQTNFKAPKEKNIPQIL